MNKDKWKIRQGKQYFESNKLVITCLPCRIWPAFPLFLIFYGYFTHLKTDEINWQNLENSENITHIALGTMQGKIW